MPYAPVETDSSVMDGFHWRDEYRFTFFDEKCYTPTIAADGNELHVGFGIRNPASGWTEVYYIGSASQGLSWNDSLLMSDLTGANAASGPTVCVSGSLVFLGWFDGGTLVYPRDVRFRKSYDSGSTWSEPIIIQQDVWADYVSYHLRFDSSSDTVFASYARRYADGHWTRLRRSLDQGEVWSEEFIIGKGPEGGPPAIASAGSQIVATIPFGLEVLFHRSSDAGQSWTEEIAISELDGFPSQGPILGADPNGGVYATWFEYKGSVYPTTGWICLARSTDFGQTWDSLKCLSSQPTGVESYIHADSERVCVAWCDERHGSPDTDIYFRMSTDMGGKWSPEMRLDNAPNPSNTPVIDVADSLIHVVWRDQRNMEWALYHKVGGWFVPGDVDKSDEVDIDDIVSLIEYVFLGGGSPEPYWAGDPNCDNSIDIDDVVYLIEYVFQGGPEPC